MVEIVPVFQNQYTMPTIIFFALVADFIASKINKNKTQKRFLASMLFLIGVVILQGWMFVTFKQRNIYQELKFSRSKAYSGNSEGLVTARLTNDSKREHTFRQYQMIVPNPERLMYYEKYHEITTDLHTLRNPSFQNEHIIKALNFYLVTLMIAITITNDKHAQHSRNYIISLVFALYVLEAHLILSEDAKITKFESQYLSQVTQKEFILFVKTLLLICVIIIKQTIVHQIRPMHEKVEISLMQTQQEHLKYSKKQDSLVNDSQVREVLANIRDLVNRINNGLEESVDGISSNKTLYQVLSIMTIFMLFTGNYEE